MYKKKIWIRRIKKKTLYDYFYYKDITINIGNLWTIIFSADQAAS